MFERSDISREQFCDQFQQESARYGHAVPGADVLGLLEGEVREDMVDALMNIKPLSRRLPDKQRSERPRPWHEQQP